MTQIALAFQNKDTEIYRAKAERKRYEIKLINFL